MSQVQRSDSQVSLTYPVQTQCLQDVGARKLDSQCWNVCGQGFACPKLVSSEWWWQSPLPTLVVHCWSWHKTVNEVQLRPSHQADQCILGPRREDIRVCFHRETDRVLDSPHTYIQPGLCTSEGP